MYRTIDASFWTDPKVRRLTPDGRNLFLYLITNPHTHVSGIYYLPRTTMTHETGFSNKVLDTLSDTLSSAGFCAFDAETETVWVRKMMKYQGKGDKNLRSAAHHITKDIHISRLIAEFIAAYPEIKPLVSDTLSIPYTVGATPIPIPIPEPKNREQNTEIYIPHGEFGLCLLTVEQFQKLQTKLGSKAIHYIDRFDRWLEENPKLQKTRKAYPSILNWADRDEQHSAKGNGNGRHRETDHEKNNRAIQAAIDRSVATEVLGDLPNVWEDAQ